MPTEVKLPNLGDGIDTGDVLEVLVKQGDIVAQDQGLIELETGKATVQVPSTAAGKVVQIHVKPGQSIPPGTLLVTLEGAVADAKPAPAKSAPNAAKPAPAPAAPQPQKPTPPNAETPAAPPKAAAPKPQPAPQPTPEPRTLNPEPSPAALPEPTQDGGVAAGPAVRRFAREVGVDLGRVTGSGPGGRITRDDVLAVV